MVPGRPGAVRRLGAPAARAGEVRMECGSGYLGMGGCSIMHRQNRSTRNSHWSRFIGTGGP